MNRERSGRGTSREHNMPYTVPLRCIIHVDNVLYLYLVNNQIYYISWVFHATLYTPLLIKAPVIIGVWK